MNTESPQNESPPLLTKHDSQQPQLKLYNIRFAVCLAFGANTLLNAMISISYAAIQEQAATKFHVSQQSINLFSLVFQAGFVPGTFLTIYLFKRFDIRKTFIFGATLQFIATILRYIAVNETILTKYFSIDTSTSLLPYYLTLTGCIIASLVQPIYTSSPARLAAEWFSVNGRDIATAILTILNTIGFGFGMFIPTLFVSPIDDSDDSVYYNYDNGNLRAETNHFGGFTGNSMFQMIYGFCGLLLTVLFHQNRPELPPSMSQYLKLEESRRSLMLSQQNAYAGAHVVGGAIGTVENIDDNNSYSRKNNNLEELKCDILTILKDINFWFLWIGFGTGFAFFVTLATLINQYTAAFGYNSDNAGIFGLLLMGCGILGSVASGIAMEITKDFNKVLKTSILLCFIITLIFVTQMKENNLIILYFLFAIWGFVAVPVLPLSFECAAECTYPINEEISSGMLMAGSSLPSVSFLLIWGHYLPNTNKGESYHNNIFNFSSYFIVGVLFVAVVVFLLFRGEYKRHNAEHMGLRDKQIARSMITNDSDEP